MSAAHDIAAVNGLTHRFYKYPARFSPRFAQAAIELFTQPGDVVLDPFMGGGTSLVEARARGRRAVGTDTSRLAYFVTKAKTTFLSPSDFRVLDDWIELLPTSTNLRQSSVTFSAPLGEQYRRHMALPETWRIRKLIELAVLSAGELPSRRQQRFARAVILRAAQTGIDTRRVMPSVSRLRDLIRSSYWSMADSLREFQRQSRAADRAAGIQGERLAVLHGTAEQLPGRPATERIGRPKLILTSPPYPGVHVLYHRWQLMGGRETAFPFWIADEQDGQTVSHYTLADRHRPADYFERIRPIYRGLRGVCTEDTTIVQLVSFKSPETDLPAYLAALEEAGFCDLVASGSKNHVWRDVPSRRWYAEQRSGSGGSREILLVHRPV